MSLQQSFDNKFYQIFLRKFESYGHRQIEDFTKDKRRMDTRIVDKFKFQYLKRVVLS